MASYIDLNDLGSFASINALWAAYPEGGQEGDYCTIDGVKYRWDKYDRMWVADPNFGPTPARSVTTFDGDVNMQNNLTVAGYIRAKGIKQPCLGLFLSEAALEAKWPDPEVGMWAIVGDESPFIVYRCDEDGEWTNTEEETTGFDDVDLSSIIINGVKGWVPISSTSDLPLEPSEAERERGYLLGTTLYVYVGTGGDTLDGKYLSAQLKGADGAPGEPGPKGDSGVDLGEVVLVNDLTTGGEGNALSAEQGKILKGMIDNIEVDLKHGSFVEALEAALDTNNVFEFLLMDEIANDSFVKPIWFKGDTYVDAAGAVVSLASLNAPAFSIDSGDVYVGTTVTITCPSGSTLYYSVNGVSQTSSADVTITINAASVVKAFVKSGDAVSDIVAKTYGIAIDHKFQFKIKLTGDNSTEYVPVVAAGSPIYTMTVDWGDGSTPSEYSNRYFAAKGCGHTYSGTAGDEFVITLRGSAIPCLAFNDSQSCNKAALVSIIDNSLECDTYFSINNSVAGGFEGCSSLMHVSSNALQNNLCYSIVLSGTALTAEEIENGFFASIKNLTSCYNMFKNLALALTSSQWNEIKNMIKNCTFLNSMFYGFKGDTRIPDDFFSEVTATLTSVAYFTHTAKSPFTGDAAALYQSALPKVSESCTTTSAFSCTNLSNRSQVPSAWGGTGS